MARALFLYVFVLSWFGVKPFLTRSFPLVRPPQTRGGDPLQQQQVPTSSSSSNNCCCGWEYPLLAVITEPDACANDERVSQTLEVLEKALAANVPAGNNNNTTTSTIDLISVRVTRDSCPTRVVSLIRALVALVEQKSRSPTTRVVVTSDWIDAAIEAGAHGIHVKESHQSKIPEIRHQFAVVASSSSSQKILPQLLIGTSAHSLESATKAVVQYQPDYLFVGTCYPTESHPEKQSKADLEGPELPGQVARAISILIGTTTKQCGPPVFAIGGIHAKNCAEPVALGASGVATIRAVLQAKDPAKVVQDMVHAMTQQQQQQQQQRQAS
jgi:thiamine-phosphate pyrophosphorylase